MEFSDITGIARSNEQVPLRLRLHNRTDRALNGSVRCTIGTWTAVNPAVQLAASGDGEIPFIVPAAALPGRTGCDPVYAVFQGDGAVASAHSLFQFSRIVDLSKITYAAAANSFRVAKGAPDAASPIKLVTSQVLADGIHIGFSWQDGDIVPLAPPTPGGPTNQAPALNMKARPGDQHGDAVEIFLDLRPESSSGRYTSDVDANPEGVLRIATYWSTGPDGKLTPQVAVHPAEAAADVSLESKPDGMHTVIIRRPPAGASFGFGLLLSDVSSATKGTTAFYLGGDHPMDPLGFVRMSARQSGLFYRVGY
jgi:hypothetical protein